MRNGAQLASQKRWEEASPHHVTHTHTHTHTHNGNEKDKVWKTQIGVSEATIKVRTEENDYCLHKARDEK